ncbi:helix-turn-helix transcriptional regulator [Psychrobacillus sp. FSL K6-4615]|uniref:helix-turn-helix domain-containing protein n=1 Tax=Psychrobacillus sp. FSL K6-4615 TaxID=2921551 RepID=UPI0030FBFA33
MKADKEQVAKRLQEIRSRSNLSISEFGKRIDNTNKSTVNSWLRGIALPPREKLLRIAFLADTSVNWILWGDRLHESCDNCSSILSNGECLKCNLEIQKEMKNFLDLEDSKFLHITVKPDKEQVAKRLQEIRSRSYLSISEFGKKIGNVNKSTMNSYLRGIALPPRERLLRIAFLADTSVNWILWGDESPESCDNCSSILSNGECLNCLHERQDEMTNFFDMVDSNLFPMTQERKSLILQIISSEIEEIKSVHCYKV